MRRFTETDKRAQQASALEYILQRCVAPRYGMSYEELDSRIQAAADVAIAESGLPRGGDVSGDEVLLGLITGFREAGLTLNGEIIPNEFVRRAAIQVVGAKASL
jgi:hypothetical protein